MKAYKRIVVLSFWVTIRIEKLFYDAMYIINYDPQTILDFVLFIITA